MLGCYPWPQWPLMTVRRLATIGSEFNFQHLAISITLGRKQTLGGSSEEANGLWLGQPLTFWSSGISNFGASGRSN